MLKNTLFIDLVEDYTGGIGLSCRVLNYLKLFLNIKSCNNVSQFEGYKEWSEIDYDLESFDIDQSNQSGCLMNYNGKIFTSINPHVYTIRKGELIGQLKMIK